LNTRQWLQQQLVASSLHVTCTILNSVNSTLPDTTGTIHHASNVLGLRLLLLLLMPRLSLLGRAPTQTAAIKLLPKKSLRTDTQDSMAARS
jgi:hypothetical protein